MLELRQYAAADREAVWSLHDLGLRQMGVHAGDGPWDDDLRQIESAYPTSGGEFVVGTVDGQVVAMGALRRRSMEVAEVKRIRVHPQFQRQGFGRAILRHLERRAGELGYRKLVLDTTPVQHGAIKLFHSEGFTETGRGAIPGMPTGMPPAIFFEKRLDPSG